MKKGLAILVLALLCAMPLFAQESGKMSLGVNIEAGLPMGDFGDGYSFGIGGTALFGYSMDPNLTLTGRAGYLSFQGKDVNGFTPDAVSVIPILVGGKYYFMPASENMRVYGAGEVGLYMIKVNIPSVTILGVTYGGGSETQSKFGFAPSLGAEFKAGDNMNVDVHANYSVISTEGSSTSWVGFGVGLVFGLQ